MDNALGISMMFLWLVVATNFMLTLAVIRRLNRDRQRVDRLEVGTRAPEFVAETVEGNVVRLADFASRSILFVFVSPTCLPCRELIPVLEDLQSGSARAGVEIRLVSTVGFEGTREFIEELEIGIPTLVAPRDKNAFLDDYKGVGTPYYCLIDEDGRVKASGYLDSAWDELVSNWRSQPGEYEIRRLGVEPAL